MARRCEGCGGEDCACCEVFIEEQNDIKYAMYYGDDALDHYQENEYEEEEE